MKHRGSALATKLFPCLGLCVAVALGGVPASAESLPEQTGAINDYAAKLGGKPQRAPLQALLDRLEQAHGVSLVLLISERDPFDDPQRYGAEIRRAWNLPDGRNAFALIVEEYGDWVFDLWVGRELGGELEPAGVSQLEQQLEQLVRRGRIRQAAHSAAQGLLQLLEGGESPLAAPQANNPWLFVVVIVLPGAVLVWLFVRWSRSTCPRCTRRLSRTRRGGKRLRYCPHCGYNR